MHKGPLHLLQAIEERKRKGLFRSLSPEITQVDFGSNDYLGFSKLGLIESKISEMKWGSTYSGSSGSRLISGNSEFAEDLETNIARFHNTESALLFNSGYDANLGLLSSIATKHDLILFDELIHASLYDGIRLSHAKHYKFRHNDLDHLKELLERNKDSAQSVFIVVESVYSMDGDSAPIKDLVAMTDNEKVFLIVDEAHAIGVFGEKGRGLCNELKCEEYVFARVYTYGKAMGCHGAAVVGSKILKDYLVNFSRSFIYTTALPPHSLFSIMAAYTLLKETDKTEELRSNINYFNSITKKKNFIKSESAIHCKIVAGNKETDDIQERAALNGFFLKGIKSPTVKEGTERLRVCIHAFNTKQQIERLAELL